MARKKARKSKVKSETALIRKLIGKLGRKKGRKRTIRKRGGPSKAYLRRLAKVAPRTPSGRFKKGSRKRRLKG